MKVKLNAILLFAASAAIVFGKTTVVYAAEAISSAAINDGNISNAVQTDNKITAAEKQTYNAASRESDKYAEQQAQAINKIPGAKVTASDLKQGAVTKKRFIRVQKPIVGVDNHLSRVDKELTELKVVISLVLTSIFVAAAIIALGTTIAAIIIWRNRAKLLPKPRAHEAEEEASVSQASRTLQKQLR